MFDRLYENHNEEIRRFIFTAARRDSFATDEIAQNTWTNVYKYLHTLSDVSAARAWIYSIARNEATRYFASRQVKFYDEASRLDTDEQPDIEEAGADDFPEALANRDELARLLSKLSDGEQQIIILHYYYDLELKEVARLHSSNYNTVKSSFRRAMAKLREYAGAAGSVATGSEVSGGGK